MWRRAQSISQEEYKKNSSFKALCRGLMILPLLPYERIMEGFNHLKGKYTSFIEKEMIKYYEDNYINGQYDKSVWWIGDLLLKTNNSVESFNSMFNRIVKIPHPTLHKFIPKLHEVINDIYKKAVNIVNNDNPISRKKRQKEKNRSVKYILDTESEEAIDMLI